MTHNPKTAKSELARLNEYSARRSTTHPGFLYGKDNKYWSEPSPETLALANHLKTQLDIARECLANVWYSEFNNTETCLEGSWIKEALLATDPNLPMGE